MARLQGKVALITGAARGQGRSHAVRLAQEGADIIAVDVVRDIENVQYPGATPEELLETATLVAGFGRRIVTVEADVRDFDALEKGVTSGVEQLGRLDIVLGNAGILAEPGPLWEMSNEQWQTTLGVNLTGVFHTVKAAVPHMLRAGNGGSIVLTSSVAGLKGIANCGDYTAAKHGVTGLAKTLAIELGPHRIRVNSLHPGCVDTQMIMNQNLFELFAPGVQNPTKEDVVDAFAGTSLMNVPWVDVDDISNAVVWLVSDESKYVTGTAMAVDAGATAM